MEDTEYKVYLKNQTYEDLLSIRNSINRAAHPERFGLVNAEIEARDQIPVPPPLPGSNDNPMLKPHALKRWWFIFPLPMTMLAAGALYILRNDGFAGVRTVQDVFGVLACITFFGSSAFPVGLPLCFTFGNADPIVDIVVPIVLSGYLLYFGLSIFGAIRRSRAVLVVLWVLLLLNLIGCQSSVGLLPMKTS